MSFSALLMLALVLGSLATLACGTAAAAPGGVVYLAGSGKLYILDAATLAERAQLNLGGPVAGMVLDARRHRLDMLVGNALWVVDPASRRVLDRIGLPFAPLALGLDRAQQRAYVLGVTAAGDGRLLALDLDTGRRLAAVSVGRRPSGFTFSPDGSRILIADAGARAAVLITLPGLKPAGIIHLAATPRQAVSLPFGHKAFVLCGDEVAVLDMRRAALLTYLPVGPQAQAMLVKPDGGEVYVSNAAGNVSVIDTSTNEISGTMPAGEGAGAMAVAADGSVLDVANAAAGTISVLSLADRSMMAVVHVGERPDRLQLGANGLYLFASDAGSDDLAVIRSSQDSNNPNTLITLLPAPPHLQGLLTASTP